jgi:hypothetical protein
MKRYDPRFSYIRPDNPEDIYFDDLPVESLIFHNELPGRSTPADIIALWYKGFYLTATMKKVLVGVLVNNINIAFRLDRSEEVALLLKTALHSEIKNDPDFKVQIMIALWKIYHETDPVAGNRYYLEAKKLVNRFRDQLEEQTLDSWNDLCQNEDPEQSLFQLGPGGWNKMGGEESDQALQ